MGLREAMLLLNESQNLETIKKSLCTLENDIANAVQ